MKRWLLALLVMALSVPVVSFAQEEATENLLFMEIPQVIGVSKKAESIKDAPMSVFVITKDDIEKWGIRSQAELYARAPGFSFPFTNFWGENHAEIRGFGSTSRMITALELMPKYQDWMFAPHFYKSVEMVRGPAGVIWGPLAQSGLINLNLRDDLQGAEFIQGIGNSGIRNTDFLYGGKSDDGKTSFFGGITVMKQAYEEMLNANDMHANGWQRMNASDAFAAVGKVKYNDFKTVFYHHRVRKEWDTDWGISWVPGSIWPVSGEGDVHSDMDATMFRAEYAFPFSGDNFGVNLYYNFRNQLWYTKLRAMNKEQTNEYGWTGNAKFMEDKVKLDFGGALYGEDKYNSPAFSSSWMYRTLGGDWYPTPIESIYHRHDFYLQSRIDPIEKFGFLLGYRYDFLEESDTKKAHIPQLGLFLRPTEKIGFKYLYNSSVRRPSGNEVAIGNKPNNEMTTAHDLSFAYEGDNLKADVTLFQQEMQDMIVSTITYTSSGVATYTFSNAAEVTVRGLEWSLKVQPSNKLDFYWTGAYNFTLEGAKEASVAGATNPDIFSDKSIKLAPKYSMNLGVDLMAIEALTISPSLRTYGKVPYRTAAGEEKEFGNAYYFDIALRSEQFKLFDGSSSISLKCLNLLDNDKKVPAHGEITYEQGLMIPEPRRYWLELKINY